MLLFANIRNEIRFVFSLCIPQSFLIVGDTDGLKQAIKKCISDSEATDGWNYFNIKIYKAHLDRRTT